MDVETYSEGGFIWNELEQKWDGLPQTNKSKKGLPIIGAYNYVTHPTFELLSIAYDLKEGVGVRFWRPGLQDPLDLFNYVRSGGLISAFNSGFEFWVWSLFCAPRLGWPTLDPLQLRCDMSKARAWSLPGSLADVGRALQLASQKDAGGSALIRKLTVPRAPTKKNPDRRWYRHTAPEDFAKFDVYNVQDVIAEAEASARIPDLCPRELPIWQFDQTVNRRGMRIDMPAVHNGIAIAEQAVAKGSAELFTITDGRARSVSEVAKILEWMGTRGVYLPSLDEDIVEEELTKIHEPAVQRVLTLRQALSFGSVKKLYAMRAQVCGDDRLRDQYAYHGAHTSLWNGQGVQVLNLYKGTINTPAEIEAALGVIASGSLEYCEAIYGDALQLLANCLRSMIIASPGCRLIMSDYSAIQAVITSCLAGEQWRIDVFRTHGKIYEAMAAELTGKTLQFYLDHREKTGKHHPDRQTYGKIPVLASDFGAWISGWKKFGADAFGDDQAIKEMILRTRARIPMIVELWGGQTRNLFGRDRAGNRALEYAELHGLEGAAVAAIQRPGTCYGYRGIRYQVHDDVMYCQPPGNGAPLCYHEPRLAPSRKTWARPWDLELSYMSHSKKLGWHREPMYGGVFTQHVVSKVAREFQADALLRLERAGYPIVMHTHDEGVADVPHGIGSAPEYLRIVNDHDWTARTGGDAWPVKAPGAEEVMRYGKWE